MLSRQHNFYQQLLQIVDGLLLGAAMWTAHAIRYYGLNDVLWFDDNRTAPPLESCYWMVFVAMVSGPLALEYVGFYRTQPSTPFWRSLWQVLRGNLLVLLLIASLVLGFHVSQAAVSRAALIIFYFLGVVVILIRWVGFYSWLERRGRQTHLRKYILLCGTAADRESWKKRFSSQPGKTFEIRAEFDLGQEGLSRFIQTLHDETVNIVVFNLDQANIPQVREALLACEAEGVEAWVSANIIQTLFTRVQFDQFAGHPLLIYRTTPAISWELAMKRVIDVIGAFVLLVFTAPLLAMIAILVRSGSRGPAIFSQARSGVHGRPFCMHKFRTMVSDAERGQAELLGRNEMVGPVFKVRNDPRITAIGHVLRRTSLDELPQLWNVIRGEMSLVGPRPLPIYETANFEDVTQRRRMSVRPGLTCLWQVRGRNRISDFDEWVRLDLEYIDRWSLWLDLAILLRTVPVVLFGWGAK